MIGREESNFKAGDDLPHIPDPLRPSHVSDYIRSGKDTNRLAPLLSLNSHNHPMNLVLQHYLSRLFHRRIGVNRDNWRFHDILGFVAGKVLAIKGEDVHVRDYALYVALRVCDHYGVHVSIGYYSNYLLERGLRTARDNAFVHDVFYKLLRHFTSSVKSAFAKSPLA